MTRDPLSLRGLLRRYGSTAVPIGSHSKEIDLKRRDISSPWYVSCRSSDFTNSKAYILHQSANPFSLGLALDMTPKASISHCKLVSKNDLGPDANHCGPNASQWNMVRVGYARVGFALTAFGMSISCCLSPLCSRLAPNANAIYGGIWALDREPIIHFTHCVITLQTYPFFSA